MRRVLIVLLACSALAAIATGPIVAAEPPPTAEAVAAQVQAAHAAGEADKIRELAAQEAPDPWLVADALLVTGAAEAAAAFAKAAAGNDVAELVKFVAAWKATSGDAASRGAIEKGNVALMAGKHAEALATFEAARGEATPVVAIRLAHGRGLALSGLGRHAEAATQLGEVATLAEALGWLARASTALVGMAWAEQDARHPEPSVAAAVRLVALETKRGSHARIAAAHWLVGQMEVARGAHAAAVVAMEQARALLAELGDGAGVARLRNSLAEVWLQKPDLERAKAEAEGAIASAQALELWPEVARGHMLLARVSRATGHLGLSISSLTSALEAAEKAGKPEGIVAVVYALGRAHGERGEGGDDEKSLEHSLRAQKLYEGLGRKDGAAASLLTAAHATLRLGRLEECKGHAERALSLAREIASPGIAGDAQYTLGEVAERQKQPDQALAAFTAALASFEAAGDRVEVARTLAAVADALRALGQLPKAREQADRALREGEALGNPGVVAYALYVGTKVRKDQGQREEALDLARRALAAYTGLKNARGVAEMQTLVKELEPAPVR